MSFWQSRSVFVTGATGLLGSWLVEALLDRGATVTCLVRDWTPHSRFVELGFTARANLVRGELEDFPLLLRVLNEYEVDTVFHLGAQTIVGTANRSPLSTFESNVRGTWNLLEACRLNGPGIRCVVLASSDKAYGIRGDVPYGEQMPLSGRYPYDASKACADLIAHAYFHTYRLPVAVTRCGNLFGGGDLNFNRLIPGTIRSALERRNPIVRSDGKFVRDYFYVRDAVGAYLHVAERFEAGNVAGEAFNFSSERPLPVMTVVRRILELTGRESLEPEILNQSAGEIPNQVLDCSKARELLAWEPRFTMDEGLRETIDWYRAHLGRMAAINA